MKKAPEVAWCEVSHWSGASQKARCSSSSQSHQFLFFSLLLKSAKSQSHGIVLRSSAVTSVGKRDLLSVLAFHARESNSALDERTRRHDVTTTRLGPNPRWTRRRFEKIASSPGYRRRLLGFASVSAIAKSWWDATAPPAMLYSFLFKPEIQQKPAI